MNTIVENITKGNWKIERTSLDDGDFQARILCESSTEKNIHNPSEPQIFIIIGENGKINGCANIHNEANAILIADAGTTTNKCKKLPSELLVENNELLEALKKIYNIENGAFGLKSFDVIQFKHEISELIQKTTV